MSNRFVKDCGSYVECAFSHLLFCFPDIQNQLSQDMIDEFMSDSNYVCHIDKANPVIEIGYKGEHTFSIR